VTENTVEYRVSFRTREPAPAKADSPEAPGHGVAEDGSAPSRPQTVRGRRNRNAESRRRGGASRNPSPAKNARLASQLALGHLIERAITDGTVDDYGDAAARFEVTRARISQVVALTLLAPEIQERILGRDLPTSARGLREVVHEPVWATQARRCGST